MSAPEPAPTDGWIEGDFEGVYAGDPRAVTGGRRDARRFDFELQSGTVTNLTLVPEPGPESDPAASTEVRQERVRQVRLLPPQGAPEGRTLFDVRVRDYRLKHPAEIRGRGYGTLVGRIQARLRPEVPERLDWTPATRTSPEHPKPLPLRDDAMLPVEAPLLWDPTHEAVEGADARLILARLRWVAAWLAWAAVTCVFAWRCGAQVAALWAGPVAVALLLRAAAAQRISGTPGLHRWLGIGLVACQLGLGFGHYEAWWRGACPDAPTLGVLWISLPVVLAALVRPRWPLRVAALLFTGVMCVACGAGGAGCAATPGAPRQAGLGPAPAARTDASGRWPAGLRLPSLPSLPDLLGGMPFGAAESDAGSPPPPGSGEIAPLPPDASTPAAAAPVSWPASQGAGRVASVPGGWVAPQDPESAGDLVLISIEHANRNPESFFASGGARRVYMQTDPIFENGGSRMRARGPFELTRLAALLSLKPDQRVAIEVHTDTGGGPREQLARSQRRAEAVAGFLVSRGHLDAGQFEIVPVGGGQPIVPRDGSYGAQAPNRRLEIRLLDPER